MSDAQCAAISRDIVERARRLGAHVTDFTGTILPRQDDPGAPIGFSATCGKINDGHSSIDVEWTPHRSQGRRRQSTRMKVAVRSDGTPTPRLARRLDEKLRDIARLQRREADVAPIDDEYAYPAWSFSIHATIASMLRHHGWDATLLTRTGRRGATWDRWAAARVADGIHGADPRHEGSDEDHWGTKSVGALLNGSRLRLGSVNFADLGIGFEEGWNDVILYLGERAIPDTAMASMKGCNIAAVLGHPGIRAEDGVVVRDIVRIDATGEIGLSLSMVRVPLAPAPPGIDVSWLRDPAQDGMD